MPVRAFGFDLDVPVWSSIDWAALTLVAAAMVATFRFIMGVLPLLVAAALAGLVWRLAGS